MTRTCVWLLAGLVACASGSTKDDDVGGDGDSAGHDGDDSAPADDGDGDGDGIARGVDCDDEDPNVSPAEDEAPYDGIDNDCDEGTPDDDLDGDGAVLAADCDDADADRSPEHDETPYDGIDNDCDNSTPDDDLDGDGFALGADCDDEDATTAPGAEEICGDGVVNDCDGSPGGAFDTCTVDRLRDATAKLVGEAASDCAGGSVAGAGDVNGDGLGDLLIGADAESSGGKSAGAAYLVLGGVSGTRNLSTADAKIVGEATADGAGYSVAGAGDVDGDGLGDLLVGAYGESSGGSYAGAAYLVLGGVSGTLDLSAADAKLAGEAESDQAGIGVAGAGDVDGDGLSDLLVGAYGESSGGKNAGAAYLVLGGVSGTLNLSTADAKLAGEAESDCAGFEVASAGDVDGDGLGDLLVGAYGESSGSPDAGAAYLVLGGVSGTRDLSDADAKLVGAATADHAGRSVAGAGDVDGDGLSDLLVGADGESSGAYLAGAAYLVLGKGWGTRDLSTADAKLVGEATYDGVGYEVAGAGDVDGDGLNDLFVSAVDEDSGGRNAGAAYVVLGGVSGTRSLSTADGKLVGEASYDAAGAGVAGAGDVDGDGLSDLLIGANFEDSGGAYAGAAYLVRGGGY